MMITVMSLAASMVMILMIGGPTWRLSTSGMTIAKQGRGGVSPEPIVFAEGRASDESADGTPGAPTEVVGKSLEGGIDPNIVELRNLMLEVAGSAAAWSDRVAESGHSRREHGDQAVDERALLIRDADAALFEIDAALSHKLGDVYKNMAQGAASNNTSVVRAALLHWEILLRRRFMSGLHTAVVGLNQDQECSGDLLQDGMFSAYFDAVLSTSAGKEQAAVDALAQLARQSACISERQSQELAARAVTCFEELSVFLRVNGLERLVPAVVAALASPLLLFYDVEKDRGPEAPLSRWFTTNREALVQAVRTQRFPAVWHGLWLYDRRTGRLFGYRSGSKSDENHVDLETFVTSIVSQDNLGQYGCSFSEMIERGVGPLGYMCVGSECSDRDSRAESREPRLPGRAGRAAHRRRRRGLTGATFLSPGLVAENLCTGNGNAAGKGPGRDACHDSRDVADPLRLDPTIACLSRPLLGGTATERAVRCLAEATGRCAKPVDSLVKHLEEVSFPGVKLGKDCQLSNPDGQTEDDEKRAEQEAAKKEYEKAEAENAKAQEEAAKAEAAAKAAADKAAEAEKALSDAKILKEEGDRLLALLGPGEWLAKQTPTYKEVEKALADLERKTAARQREAERTKNEAARECEEARQANEKAQQAFNRYHKKGRCAQDVPECGTDDCSGMSAAA
ncbi:MAG: hypothetical protein M3Q08_17745, partial [Pseudomonadota bacterium]|nr:hypothetical protein [Pseudomonadota bacterium]